MTVSKIAASVFCLFVYLYPAQSQQRDWPQLDLRKDSAFGISLAKAYQHLLKKKVDHSVIVAVIDSGIDTAHEDLKQNLWVNPDEIPGNGVDDDNDGYTDDVHGWDFIGGKSGDVNYDNFEITRLFREKQAIYDSLSYTQVPESDLKQYKEYSAMKKVYWSQYNNATSMIRKITDIRSALDSIKHKIGKSEPLAADLEHFTPSSKEEEEAEQIAFSELKEQRHSFTSLLAYLDTTYDYYRKLLDYHLNTSFDPRKIVGDNYNDPSEKFYGNNDINGPHALHGTHVAGIIGAIRQNGIGIDGIADQVKLLVVRVVPDGDERDKDVANGIRYAVDKSAKIINMSFGKAYTKDKKVVDDAVKYAMQHDVLIVHAAGNEGKDLDKSGNRVYPNKFYADSSGQAGAWLTVGATGFKDDSTLVADFSNYGKMTVDVFAPGVRVFSCLPGSSYGYENGTSMAAPVVSGVAALLREYYPNLTAQDVKDIIMHSVTRPAHDVLIRTQSGPRHVQMSDICVSGGIVNAYDALVLASKYKRGGDK